MQDSLAAIAQAAQGLWVITYEPLVHQYTWNWISDLPMGFLTFDKIERSSQSSCKF